MKDRGHLKTHREVTIWTIQRIFILVFLLGLDSILYLHIRKHGLLGRSEIEAVKVDMVHAATLDIRSGPLSTPFRPLHQRSQGMNYHIQNTLPKFLNPIEAMLTDSPTGFVIGNDITMADITLFEAVKFNLDAPYVSAAWIDQYPAIARHQTLVPCSRILNR